MYLSLPLFIKNTRELVIYLVRVDPEKRIEKVSPSVCTFLHALILGMCMCIKNLMATECVCIHLHMYVLHTYVCITYVCICTKILNFIKVSIGLIFQCYKRKETRKHLA